MYCGTIATDINIIMHVWGKWPGYVLLAVFLWHHVYRGLVVSVFLSRAVVEIQSLSLAAEDQSAISVEERFQIRWTPVNDVLLVAILLSPMAMLLTFVLDVWSFFDVFGVPSPPLLAVQSYSELRTVLMPAMQSLFSAVLATVIFWLGNDPVNGIFYSRILFSAAVTMSCASMLVGLCRLLYTSHCRDKGVWRTFFLLVKGGLLRPSDPAASLEGFFAALWKWLLVHVGRIFGFHFFEEEGDGPTSGVIEMKIMLAG